MKVAVIGSGPSGLASARYLIANGFDCTVFEQTGKVGGVWNYNERVGYDEEGIPLHSVMYKDLLTNQPKELMSYADYPHPETTRSYIPQAQVIEYINNFAKHFNIFQTVKFYKRVVLVEPIENDRWKLTIEDMKSKQQETFEFDVVMVCTGSYHKLTIPNIPGMDTFNGKQFHSNIYRTPEGYEGKKVLVIGAGPSGQDIASKISAVADHVTLSHKFRGNVRVAPAVVQKPVVKRIIGSRIIFSDDTEETFDIIVYATGYQYVFPFLSEKCDITVENRWIKYLYKHIVNISHPTMGFIGMAFLLCHFPVYDLQARYYVAYLMKKFNLPDKDAMKKDIMDDLERKLKKGMKERDIHKIGLEQEMYCDDLATTAKTPSLRKAIHKLFASVLADRNTADCFKIKDDDNFEKITCSF